MYSMFLCCCAPVHVKEEEMKRRRNQQPVAGKPDNLHIKSQKPKKIASEFYARYTISYGTSIQPE